MALIFACLYSTSNWVASSSCLFASLKLTVGWCEDFWFFSKNNHPLMALFCANTVHPFTKCMRFFSLFAEIGILLFFSSLFARTSAANTNEDIQAVTAAGYFIILGAITVPTMIFQKLFFYLLATPCLVTDKSSTGGCRWMCIRSCSRCSSLSGYCFTFLLGAVFIIVGAVLWAAAPPSNMPPGGKGAYMAFYSYALVQQYVYWFVPPLFTSFFPFKWKNCFALANFFITPCMGKDYMGTWFAQRNEVLNIIRYNIKERGADQFTAPVDEVFMVLDQRNSRLRDRLKTNSIGSGSIGGSSDASLVGLQLLPPALLAMPPKPPAPPAAFTAAPATGGAELTINMTKLNGSLGVDLADNGGRVSVKCIKEMVGVADSEHPAKSATPPLQPGDEVVSINGQSYTTFKDCVLKVRGSPESVCLVVKRG